MSLWAELKRRNVFRVAAAYLVASWLIVQVVGAIIEPLALPASFATIVIVLLGIGFPIALVIAWIYEVTPEGVRVTSANATSPSNGRSGQRLNYVIVALLVAAVGLLAFDTLVTPDAGSEQAPAAIADDATSIEPQSIDEQVIAEPRITLAVLPFEDSSQAGDRPWLADGIAQEIRSLLRLVEGLSVMGDATSLSLRGSEFGALRGDWNIDYVLTGNVLSSDDRLRIRVDLTNTDTGVAAYSDSHERMHDDSFALIDEVAEAIARAMQVTLGVGDVAGRPGMTRNVAAFEEYLQGIGIPPFVPQNARNAIAHFERAVSFDDDFAHAWLSLYVTSTILDGLLQREGGEPAARVRADAALSRVQELTPGLPELILTDVILNPGLDFFELRRRFDNFALSATAADYPDTEIAFAEGAILFITGRIAEATGLFERAYAVDPLNGTLVQMVTESYAAVGRAEESRAVAGAFLEQAGLVPALVVITRSAHTALEIGDRELIDQVLARWRQLGNTGDYVRLMNRMGELIDQPDRALEELEAYFRSDKGPFWATHSIMWAAYFGDEDLVLEMLAEADLFNRAIHFGRPLLAETRKTDGFRELVRSIGLEPFWRETGDWPDYCRPAGLNDFECF